MRQLNEDAPPIGYAHRFALIWRVLAFVVLAGATVITGYVVVIYDSLPPAEHVGAFGRYRGPALSTLTLNVQERQWILWTPAQTERVILPSAGHCVEGDDVETSLPVPPKRMRYWKSDEPAIEDDKVAIDVSGSYALQENGLKAVACYTRMRPARMNFTKYTFNIYNSSDVPKGMHSIETIQVIPKIPYAEGLSLMGAMAGGSYAELHYGDSVEIEYNNTLRESQRDILFVVIGALIALGAAMVLESLRPGVEKRCAPLVAQALGRLFRSCAGVARFVSLFCGVRAEARSKIEHDECESIHLFKFRRQK